MVLQKDSESDIYGKCEFRGRFTENESKKYLNKNELFDMTRTRNGEIWLGKSNIHTLKSSVIEENNK